MVGHGPLNAELTYSAHSIIENRALNTESASAIVELLTRLDQRIEALEANVALILSRLPTGADRRISQTPIEHDDRRSRMGEI